MTTTTIDIECPDHLKTVFGEQPYLEVQNDLGNVARDACLVWLLESVTGLWLSWHPEDAERALEKKFELYPRLSCGHLTFTKPDRLSSAVYDRCVVEDTPDFDLSQLRVNRTRVLEATSAASIDSLGLSLEDRRALLTETRLGSKTGYDEYELLASVTRENYFDFVQEFWGEVIAERPIWNWHIEYIAGELQYVAERVFRGQPKEYDLVINVPPGSTKSTLVSIMLSPWSWTRMPSARFLGGSYVDTLAMDLSRKNRDVVLSPKYRRAFPEIELRKDQQAKSHFVNTKGGSRYSFGVQGTVTGMHAHFIGIDDPLNPERAVSEVELENANRVMSETLFTRKVDKDLTPTILIMQRLHQNDPTAHVLVKYERVKHICLPAEDGEDVKPASLRERYVDGLLDPVRLSAKTLQENFKALGEFSYAGQFDQTPVPRGGAMFKPGRITIEESPHLVKFDDRVLRYWDKAGTQGAGAYTAGVLMGKDNQGRFWILDVIRGQWSMDEREATIKQTAVVDGHDVKIKVEQEPGSGGKDIALYTVRNLAGYNIEVDRVGSSSGNKTVRAGPLAAQVNGGNVYMRPAPWNKDYLDELKYFPASKYKDQVDASSGAFNDLSEGEVEVGTL